MNRILDWFRSLFWKEEMELTLVGLQYSGKTTFVNVIAVSSSRFQKFKFMFYLLSRGQPPRQQCYHFVIIANTLVL